MCTCDVTHEALICWWNERVCVQVLDDGGQAEWSELMAAIHRSVHTQKYLLSLCWVTTLPTSHAADGFVVLLQEVRQLLIKAEYVNTCT